MFVTIINYQFSENIKNALLTPFDEWDISRLKTDQNLLVIIIIAHELTLTYC